MAKAIVQAVQQQEPAGRFIKLKDTTSGVVSSEWVPITYGQAVNKTSQALREKEPAGKKAKKKQLQQQQKPAATQTESESPKRVKFETAAPNGGTMDASNGSAEQSKPQKRKNDEEDSEETTNQQAGKKRKVTTDTSFVKPSWWGVKPVINRVVATGSTDPNGTISTQVLGPIRTPGEKRQPTFQMGRSQVQQAKMEMDAPIPLETPLVSRQSSMFRFLSNTGIFGRRDSAVSAVEPPPLGFANSTLTIDPAFYGDFKSEPEQMGKASVQHLRARQFQNQQTSKKANDMDNMPTSGLVNDSEIAPPPKALKSQMSDWLASFLPSPSKQGTSQEEANNSNNESAIPPPPGGGANMGRRASSAFFDSLVESPSLLLTSLKSGVSSMFGDSVYAPEDDAAPIRRFPSSFQQQQPQQNGLPVLGTKAKGSRRDSLLDDVDETDDIRNLRNVKPTDVTSSQPRRFY